MLIPYWKSVHQILQEVFRNNIPFRFDTLYLGNFSQEINAKDKKLMSILLAACKKSITRKWLKQQAPLIDDWIDIVYEIYKMRLTYYLKLRQEESTSIWFEWNIYIASRRADFIWCILYVFNSSTHIPPGSMYIVLFTVPDRPFKEGQCTSHQKTVKCFLSLGVCLFSFWIWNPW